MVAVSVFVFDVVVAWWNDGDIAVDSNADDDGAIPTHFMLFEFPLLQRIAVWWICSMCL